MSATIILEDGTGTNPASNCYISIADALTYFSGSLNDGGFTAASTDMQTRLLLTATRTLDAVVEYSGFKAYILQPMQWPRVLARDPNQYGGAYYRRPDTYLAQYWDSTSLPAPLKAAVCEMARFLLTANTQNDDRTSDAPGKGIGTFEVYQGIKVQFDKRDQRPIIPDSLQFLISQIGEARSARGGNVRVSRA